ncbi:hypothetical protein EFP44_02280, partial [Lacticaseibacillus paracasei]|nr:hypothetical protein [Lacticaseibacillus paracasei]
LLKDGFVVNTILKEADLFCPNSVRINFTIYPINKKKVIISGKVQPFPTAMSLSSHHQSHHHTAGSDCWHE